MSSQHYQCLLLLFSSLKEENSLTTFLKIKKNPTHREKKMHLHSQSGDTFSFFPQNPTGSPGQTLPLFLGKHLFFLISYLGESRMFAFRLCQQHGGDSPIFQLGCQPVTHLRWKSGSVKQKKNGESSGPSYSECVTPPGDVFLCRRGHRPWQTQWAELDLKLWGNL